MRTECTVCTVTGMEKTMPLVEVRDSLGHRVDEAHFRDERTIITKNGQPRAALISFETYQQLISNIKAS